MLSLRASGAAHQTVTSCCEAQNRRHSNLKFNIDNERIAVFLKNLTNYRMVADARSRTYYMLSVQIEETLNCQYGNFVTWFIIFCFGKMYVNNVIQQAVVDALQLSPPIILPAVVEADNNPLLLKPCRL